MAYNKKLAERLRTYLADIPNLNVKEKNMFGGLAFMVNGKMCVNVSGENLMCRFDPDLQNELSEKTGYEPMIMKSRKYTGYCYVQPEGFAAEEDFEYWVNLCLDFNKPAKASKRDGKKK